MLAEVPERCWTGLEVTKVSETGAHHLPPGPLGTGGLGAGPAGSLCDWRIKHNQMIVFYFIPPLQCYIATV